MFIATHKRRTRKLLSIATVVLFTIIEASAVVVYVKPNGNATVDGKGGWSGATTLENALATQNSATSPVDIWVAAGNYKPGQSNKENSFKVQNGAQLYGGFVGTETSLNQRDWRRNRTVLDGNYYNYNVIKIDKVSNVRIDGFIIEKGRATGGG